LFPLPLRRVVKVCELTQKAYPGPATGENYSGYAVTVNPATGILGGDNGIGKPQRSGVDELFLVTDSNDVYHGN
jgi:hypothetical protein